MASLKADPKLSRQLKLEGPMLLWRNGAGGRREGLLLTTDVCDNLRCLDRHIGLHALWVEEGLVSASERGRAITTRSRPGTNTSARRAFFITLGLDDGAVEPQAGEAQDPAALAWLREALDAELRAVLLARFEGARRLLRERAAARERTAKPVRPVEGVPEASSPGRVAVPLALAPVLPLFAPAAPSPLPGRPGRNDPCPCGSGQKYKKCCLGRAGQG